MSQTSVSERLDRGMVGEVATLRPAGQRARVYAKRIHRVDVAVGGNDDGTYAFTVSTPAGMLPENPVTVSVDAAGSSADQIVSSLTDTLNTAAQTIDGVSIPLLRNVVRATANTDADAVEIVAVRSGEPFTIEITSNPNGNLVQTTASDAIARSLPMGIAMVDVDGSTTRAPQAGDTATRILGCLVRGRAAYMGESNPHVGGRHHEGDTLNIVRDGDVWVRPEEPVAVDDPVYVRVNATGNEQAGAWRRSPDGTAQVTTATPTPANDTVYRLHIDIPASSETYPFEMTSDATGTATEICNAFRTAMAADPAFTARVVASGTNTLVLSGTTPGEAFQIRSTGPGSWASLTETTAPVADTVRLAGARWLTDGSSTTAAMLGLALA